MGQHFHLLLGCLEAVLGFTISIFMPKIALVLFIPVALVPQLQGIAAIASISLVVYTFSKEIYSFIKKMRNK